MHQFPTHPLWSIYDIFLVLTLHLGENRFRPILKLFKKNLQKLRKKENIVYMLNRI